MNQKLLLKGTLFLILAGFLSRFIGFFYRIYLSNILGSKNLGIYQLIFPIYSICYTIYASGIQTGISKLISSLTPKSSQKQSKYSLLSPFFTGVTLSLLLSFTLSNLLYKYADFISIYLLNEKLCKTPLQILSLVFPFCGFTACINGFYYSKKQTAIPSLTQLVEQIIRVSCVFLISSLCLVNNVSCEIAVIGLVIGECASCLFIMFALVFNKDFKETFHCIFTKKQKYTHYLYPFRKFFAFTLPLTFNKLLVNLLGSLESILIPLMLIKYGSTHSNALSIYGILTGMAMSFISFPSTITNSLSVILLPTISEADSLGDTKSISKTINQTLHYSLIIGIFSLIFFILFGNELGLIAFHNSKAGTFITILAWLCPFMYITTTFSSILNGLGKTNITFRNSIINTSMRLLFVIFLIPFIGIMGYLLGLLVSCISICFLDYFSLKKYICFNIDLKKSLIKPVTITLITGFIIKLIYHYLLATMTISPVAILFLLCIIFLVSNILLFTKFKLISLINPFS